MPIYQMYLIHLQDYDLDTVHQITRSPKDLLVRWARDSGTIKPAAIHNGEGVCHYFHMTEMGRGGGARADLDGQHRQVRHGQHTWSGNYKAGIWNATPWSGVGSGVHTGEDPFNSLSIPMPMERKSNTGSTIMARSSGTGTTATPP